MLGRYTLANNVKVTLAADVSAVASSITVNAASGIFNNPPDPTGDAASGGLSIATIQDAALPPTKTEIITYTGVTDNGNGTLTLTGVLRGIEGTTARSWTSGAVLFQSATAGQFSDPLLSLDRSGAGKVKIGASSVELDGATTTMLPKNSEGAVVLSAGTSKGSNLGFNGGFLQLYGDSNPDNDPAGKGRAVLSSSGELRLYSGQNIVLASANGVLVSGYADLMTDISIKFLGGSNACLKYGDAQVVGERRTGWTASTGVGARGSFPTYTAVQLGSAYNATVQQQLNAALDHIQVLSQQVKALKDDLLAHGLIGQ